MGGTMEVGCSGEAEANEGEESGDGVNNQDR